MGGLVRYAGVAVTALLLGGCQVLASVFEDGTLRALALFVAVAVVLGILVTRMRR